MNLDEEDQIGVRGQRLNLGAGSKLVDIRARKIYVCGKRNTTVPGQMGLSYTSSCVSRPEETRSFVREQNLAG